MLDVRDFMSASSSGFPFDAIRILVADMPCGNEAAAQLAFDHGRELACFHDSLHGLVRMVAFLARWQAGAVPSLVRPVVALFAASHGHQPAATPLVTQRVELLAAGGGAINQVCALHDFGLKVFDLALQLPTPSIGQSDAFEENACVATIAFGMEAIAGGLDGLVLGDLGLGYHASVAAMACLLAGGAPNHWVFSDDQIALVQSAIGLHGQIKDPLEILRRCGGREIAALVGAILAARHQKIPVVLDGYAALAAAAVLHALRSDALDHCVLAAPFEHDAYSVWASSLGLEPVLKTSLGLSEGASGAMALCLYKSALVVCKDMALRSSLAF